MQGEDSLSSLIVAVNGKRDSAPKECLIRDRLFFEKIGR
jgi:hypothetical protein